ncbi:MAG: IclR family transcriptional regulator [Ilumatobacteraceae bacterium]
MARRVQPIAADRAESADIDGESSSRATPRATDRGLALLRAVADTAAEGMTGISLAEAARRVGLTPSTALRQLRALEAAGFAMRDDEGRYVPGVELLRIARALSSSATLPRIAAPVLRALADETGESAYLAEAVDESTATYVAMHAGSHTVRHVSWLGHEIPRRGTAVGAALAGRTDHDGVASRVNAVEDGTTAVSAPVLDAAGEVVAALSVVGPSYRFDGASLRRARSAVAREAAALSRQLGAPAPAAARSRRGRTARTP